MASLIVLIIFGLGIALFATQNTGVIHIVLGSYVLTGIPLYVIVVGSILLGVLVSWLISIVNTFSTLFTLHTKDVMLKRSQKIINDLQEKNRALEMKIAGQKEEETVHEEEKAHEETKTPYFRQNFHLSAR